MMMMLKAKLSWVTVGSFLCFIWCICDRFCQFYTYEHGTYLLWHLWMFLHTTMFVTSIPVQRCFRSNWFGGLCQSTKIFIKYVIVNLCLLKGHGILTVLCVLKSLKLFLDRVYIFANSPNKAFFSVRFEDALYQFCNLKCIVLN
jgi:hypothetical protein